MKRLMLVGLAMGLMVGCSNSSSGGEGSSTPALVKNDTLGYGDLLTAHAWCDEYYRDGKKVREKIVFSETGYFSTMLQEIRADGSLGTGESDTPPGGVRWSINQDRLELAAKMEGQSMHLSALLTFSEQNGVPCYEMTDLIMNGVKEPARENAAPSIKCKCK